jgi:hypothetical protein
MSVRNMDLDCSQTMQSLARPRHKPRSHRGSELSSDPSPHVLPHMQSPFQLGSLRHLTHMPMSAQAVPLTVAVMGWLID